MGNMALLLDRLSLPLGRPLSDGLGKEGHEFSSRSPLIETERRQIAGGRENGCRSRWRSQKDRNRVDLHDECGQSTGKAADRVAWR